jgi:type II secretory pathway pseudopilin PulG
MQRRSNSGLTLIELLVVIVIILSLGTLLLVAIGMITSHAKEEKTSAIITAIGKAIALAGANRAGTISSVEHPLAGSRAPRFLFRRFTPPADTGTGAVASGAALDTAADALAGLSATSQLPGRASGSSASDLMLPSDLYADQSSYLLFGVKREYIGILGALQKRVTKYILLPLPFQGQASLAASLFPALTTAALPQDTVPTDVQDADPAFGHPSGSKQALDYLFGASAVQGDLSALNAIHLADPTTAANASTIAGTGNTTVDNAFRNPINPRQISAPPGTPGAIGDPTLLPLLYTDGKPEITWKPGCVYVSGGVPDYAGTKTQSFTLASGGSPGGGGMWVHYRLPGMAIYDAWGVEILFSIAPQGGVRLMSAGPDGVFAFNPVANHILDSSDPELGPSGDDTDGIHDNIRTGVFEQR